MHELSVCQALLTEVERAVATHGARGVSRILVHNGLLSGVESHLLREAFAVVRLGSVAATAVLEVEGIAPRVRCPACGAESRTPPNALACPQCGEWRTTLVAGHELLLASLELEL